MTSAEYLSYPSTEAVYKIIKYASTKKYVLNMLHKSDTDTYDRCEMF